MTTKEAKTNNVNIYSDALLRVTGVVEVNGEWWLVPKSANGWKRRQRLRLTPQAELERLKLARHISPEWLGIQGKTGPRIAQDERGRGNVTNVSTPGPMRQNAS